MCNDKVESQLKVEYPASPAAAALACSALCLAVVALWRLPAGSGPATAGVPGPGASGLGGRATRRLALTLCAIGIALGGAAPADARETGLRLRRGAGMDLNGTEPDGLLRTEPDGLPRAELSPSGAERPLPDGESHGANEVSVTSMTFNRQNRRLN